MDCEPEMDEDVTSFAVVRCEARAQRAKGLRAQTKITTYGVDQTRPRFTLKGRLEESPRAAPRGCMHAHTHTRAHRHTHTHAKEREREEERIFEKECLCDLQATDLFRKWGEECKSYKHSHRKPMSVRMYITVIVIVLFMALA